MPDISMCTKLDCPKSQSCYRFKATPSEYWQSYMSPEFTVDGCGHYWPLHELKASERAENYETPANGTTIGEG